MQRTYEIVLTRAVMRRTGYTQAQMAAQLGVAQSQVSRLIHGQMAMDPREARLLCEIAGVTVDQSWERHDRLLRLASDMQTLALDAGERAPGMATLLAEMA